VALRKDWICMRIFAVRNVAGVSPDGREWIGNVRENTEDLYAGLEHTVVPGVVESLKIIRSMRPHVCAIASSMRARMDARNPRHS